MDNKNLPSTKWQPIFEEQQIRSVEELQTLQVDLRKYSVLATKANDDDEKQSLAQIFKIPKETLELIVFLDSNNLSSSKWQPLFEKQQIQSVDDISSFLSGDFTKCSFLASNANDDAEKQSLAELFKIPKETLELIVFLDSNNLSSSKWQPLFKKHQIQTVDDIPSFLQGNLEKCSFLASKASDDDEKQSLAELFKIPEETLELIVFLDSNNLSSSKWQPLFEKQQIQTVDDIPSSLQGNLEKCSFLASKASDDDEKQSLTELFKIPKETLELIVFLDSNNLPSSKWQPLFEKQQIQTVNDIPSSLQGDLKKCSFLASNANDDAEKQSLAELFKIPKETLELIVFLDSNNLSSSKWQPLFEKHQIQTVDDISSFLSGDFKKCSFLASNANDDAEKQSLAELFKIPKETLELIVFLDSNNLSSSKWQPLFKKHQIQTVDDIPSFLQGNLEKCNFLASKASDDDEKQSLAGLFKIPKETLELIVFLDSNNLSSSKWQPLFEKQQIQTVDDIPSSLQGDLKKYSFLATKANDDDEKQSLAQIFKIPKETLELIVFLDSNNLLSSKWQPLFEQQQIQSVDDISSFLSGDFKKCSFLASNANDDAEKQSLAELFKIPKETLELIVFLDSNNLLSSKWQPLFEQQQIQSVDDISSFLSGDLKKCSFLASKASDDDEKQCLAELFKIPKETLELIVFLDSNNLSSSKWQPLFEKQQIQTVDDIPSSLQGNLEKCSFLASKASDDDEKQCLAQIFKISKETLELMVFLDSNNLPSSKWQPLFEQQQIRNVEQLPTFQSDFKKCIALAANTSNDEKQCLAKVFRIAKQTPVMVIDFIHFLEKLGHVKHFPQKLTLQDALLIRQIEPGHCRGTFDAHKLFYLMLEKIMMSNYECRKVFLFEQHKDEDDDYEIAVHPMDSLFALIHCADDFLRQDLYSKLMSCQLAVPLLLPDPVSDTIVFPLWAMYSSIKQWKCRVQKSETEFTFEAHDSRVVDCQVPLISFIRFNHPLNCSKSKILNSVISNLKHDFFFNHECEGSSVSRQFVDGLVEACWYFPSGEKSDIFSNAITFANLRGNASKHTQQLDFLMTHSDMLFVFLNEKDINSESTEIFSQINKNGKVIFILHSEKGKQNIKALVPNCEILLLRKEPAAIVRSIRLKITKRMSESQFHYCQLSQTLTSCNELCIKVDVDSPSCKQGQTLASNIMNELNGKQPADVKDIMVPLQGPNLWHKWAELDKKENRMKWEDSGFLGVEGFSTKMKVEKKVVRKHQLEKAKTLSGVMKMFLDVLLDKPIEVRSYFLQWLKFYFDDFSHKNLPDLHRECQITRDKLRSKKIAEHEVKELQSLLREQAEKLINASFGPEHLFRELAQLYESTLFMESKDNEEILSRIKMLPKVAAELLLLGHTLEIIDGDVAHIPQVWITSVLEDLTQLTNNSKIFILSVLGIQSTGKSTLLNTLFGVRFAVSAGQCTRGAYFQLLKLDDKLSTETKCDYVLVIDTEGLRAPELSDQDTQQHDNELAALVIGLASVTIINIFGEVPADIDGILQTTVHAFICMKNVELNPSCQFVKHHVANVSASKTNEGRKQFLDKLNRMTVLAAKAEHCEGLYVHFNDVITFNDKDDVHNFPSLWEGNPPMAPVNPAYCETAVKLKSKFITDLSKSTNFLCSVDDFKERVTLLWDAILRENFIFSFKNTLKIEGYSRVDAEYSRWSWKMQKLVLERENTTSNYITSSDNSNLDKIEQDQIYTIHQQLDEKYETVMKKQLEQSNQQLRSSQKTTGTSYYFN